MKIEHERCGIIGGGQMGEALLRGLLETGLFTADGLIIAEVDTTRQHTLTDTYGVTVTSRPDELATFARVIILAVKPQVMAQVLESYRSLITTDHLVLSIAAGISLQTLAAGLTAGVPIIRVMPNTPALVLAGASALAANDHVQEKDRQLALRIFSAVGTCVEVEEHLLDGVTGLSGSGPGYIFALMEAMVDGGVLVGLPRPIANQLVLQTFYGAAKLALETGESLAVLKGKVTSPGGTTITGLQVIEESGVRGALMNAVEAATNRSRELG